MVLPTPSVFEENMLSTLSSFVFFNKVLLPLYWILECIFIIPPINSQVEIVSLILEDEKFLSDLFGQLRDAKTSEDRRKELVSEERILRILICNLFFRAGVVLERVLPVLADSAATEQGKLLQDPFQPWSSSW